MPKLALTTKASVQPSTRTRRLIDERIEKRAKLDQLTKDVEELDVIILKELKKAGAPIENDDVKVTKVDSESRNIMKDLLLEQGVKPSIIAKSMRVTPYSYPKFTLKTK